MIKGGVILFQISQKERFLHLLRQPSPLEDNFTMCLSFSDPPGKTFSPLQFFSLDKKRIDLDTQLKGELADCFRNFVKVFRNPTGRAGIG